MSGTLKQWFEAHPPAGQVLRWVVFIAIIIGFNELRRPFGPLPSWIFITVAALLTSFGLFGTIQHMKAPALEDESRDWGGAPLLFIFGIVLLIIGVAT